MFLSNVKFYVKSTISSIQLVWTTFKISEDFETKAHIETWTNNVSIKLENATQIERMTITATWWVATIVKRWLTQADVKVESVWFQRQWLDWAIWVITAFASDMLDTDSANNTLNANMTYEWINTFNWNVVLNKWFRVPEFDDTIERDIKIPTPEDGMMCYLQDVEDYYSYKNWIWTKWLGWSWWSVTWYQDSTDDWSLAGTINWINTTFNLSNTPAQPQAVILTYNWQTLDYWSDYTIIGKVITMILVPVSGKLTAIYPDTPVWTGSADTRVISNTDAHNWELYRSTDDSNSLYYKDNGWDVVKLIDVTTNKIPQALLMDWWITWEIKIWSTTVAPINWLIADWSVINRTTYSALFWVIWTTYWVWNWSTTFNLPNLKGRVVIWYDSTQTEFDTLWETGWEKSHLLTTNEIPGHSHNYTVSTTSGAWSSYPLVSWSSNNTPVTYSTSSTWWWLSHNNLQPYITLNYIIKT